MKLFEMIIEDGDNVFKSVRPAKDLKTLKFMYGCNGEFVRITDVTERYKEGLCSDGGLSFLRKTLELAAYGKNEIDIIISLLQSIY